MALRPHNRPPFSNLLKLVYFAQHISVIKPYNPTVLTTKQVTSNASA